MPFGLPPPPEGSFDTLAVGLGDNVQDLQQVGTAITSAIATAGIDNAKDLRKVNSAFNRPLNNAVRANAVDLNPIAESVAQHMAAGVMANAADLMNVPTATAEETLETVSPPASAAGSNAPGSGGETLRTTLPVAAPCMVWRVTAVPNPSGGYYGTCAVQVVGQNATNPPPPAVIVYQGTDSVAAIGTIQGICPSGNATLPPLDNPCGPVSVAPPSPVGSPLPVKSPCTWYAMIGDIDTKQWTYYVIKTFADAQSYWAMWTNQTGNHLIQTSFWDDPQAMQNCMDTWIALHGWQIGGLCVGPYTLLDWNTFYAGCQQTPQPGPTTPSPAPGPQPNPLPSSPCPPPTVNCPPPVINVNVPQATTTVNVTIKPCEPVGSGPQMPTPPTAPQPPISPHPPSPPVAPQPPSNGRLHHPEQPPPQPPSQPMPDADDFRRRHHREPPPGCPPVPDCIAHGIGYPGTLEFCQCWAALPEAIYGLLGGLSDWANSHLTMRELRGLIKGYKDSGSVTNPGGYLIDGLVRLLRLLMDDFGPYFERALNIIRCAIHYTASIQTAGFPPLVPLLLAVKWLLEALKEWELGTDAALWLIDRIRLDFGPFEELLDRLISYAMPVEPPSPAEATHAYMMGQIDYRVRDCVYQLHGLNPAMMLPFMMADAEALTADECIEIGYRRDMSTADMDQLLFDRGWKRDWDRQAKLDLHWEIPTIGDHLHWLSRNVDDAEYVQRFGLLDGFATVDEIRAIGPWPEYHTVVDPHGRNFWHTYGEDLTIVGMRQVNAAFHYAAHWIQPSPEQMKEFVYRLRPGAPEMNVQFTLADYDRILAEQDYAPLARQWFAATAYHVPALTYVINMYRQGVIDEARLQQYHLDLGYKEEDSRNFVEVDRVFKAQFRTQRFAGWTPHAVGTAFAIGILNEADALDKLRRIGATNAEARDCLDAARAHLDVTAATRSRSRLITRTVSRVTRSIAVGTLTDSDAIDMLVGLGFPLGYATRIIAAENATASTNMVVAQIKVVRMRYMDGYITIDDASQALAALGITGTRVNQYISLWSLQNGPRRKHRTASQIVSDVAYGQMTTPEATARLANLGYNQPDTMLYLADAQRRIVQREASGNAAGSRANAAAAREQDRLAREARRQAKELQREARANAPRSVLTKWARNGTITIGTFRARMHQQGYASADVDRYADDIIKDVTQGILAKWSKHGIINIAYYRVRLTKLGYSTDDVDRFIQDAGGSATGLPPQINIGTAFGPATPG